jgi:voltage-gated potassium channel
MDWRSLTDYFKTGFHAGPRPWQRRCYAVIFEADTLAGRAFDVLLLATILLSVAMVMLESVRSVRQEWGPQLIAIEWGITLLFTAEYVARLACVDRPLRYVFSFFGVVDLLSILPTFLAPFAPHSHSVATIRTLRLLRVFRVLKMGRHLSEAHILLRALRHTWPKITVFLTVIFCSIIILGTLMYLIEGGHQSGFDNIPLSVYWAVVTMTTVGFGDITPVTPLGKFVAALIMLFGYAIIIVPTGIFSAEVMRGAKPKSFTCPGCGRQQHSQDALYCASCGSELSDQS